MTIIQLIGAVLLLGSTFVSETKLTGVLKKGRKA